MITDLSESQAREFLAAQGTARVGFDDESGPTVFAIAFVFDGRTIYGCCNDPSKARLLNRAGANLWMQTATTNARDGWTSVTVHGEIEVLDEQAASLATNLMRVRCPSFDTLTNALPVTLFAVHVLDVSGSRTAGSLQCSGSHAG